MGGFDKNIYRREDPAPYAKIIVNPIEKDRNAKEEGYTGLQDSSSQQVSAILVSCFRKILSIFSGGGGHLAFSGDLPHLMQRILILRQYLSTLAAEDQSHNPDFTQELSELWHNLVDDCNSLSFPEGPPSEIFIKIKFLISQIDHFPLGADHTLGYYFNHYAGQEWIPFPFMELLQGLHLEYTMSPSISTLNTWLQLLEEILSASRQKPAQ